MKTREELLAELASLGIDVTKPIRKSRSDVGQSRQEYAPRSDCGQSRGAYNMTAAKYRAIYEKMLHGQQTGDGDGEDTLVRDRNEIFPPNLNKFYKRTVGKDRDYINSTTKPAHIEHARWRWLMAEYAENPDTWRKHISKWYFIKDTEIDSWTYTEWSWAYVKELGHIDNRTADHPIILKYDDYLRGLYGYPNYDRSGEIIWAK